MNLSRLVAIPRLSRNALTRLLDLRTEIAGPRFTPLTRDGEIVGHIETAHWTRDRVKLVGWCRSGRLSAGLDGTQPQSVTTWIERQDVAATHPDAPLLSGFEIEVQRSRPDAPVVVGIDGENAAARLAPPARSREWRARLAQVPGALLFASGHTRDVLRYLRTGDAGLSVALRDAFGFGEMVRNAPLVPPDIFGPSPHPAPDQPTVIIVPVFKAAEQVERLLDCFDQGIDVPHHILLIDDGSDDPLVTDLLNRFAGRHPENVTVETLPDNRGFVAAVNHGLGLARGLGQHVILLNTDTLPPTNWASRLLAPILTDPTVASVTPLSNTAEIASIPAQGVPSETTHDLVETIDATARQIGSAWREVAIPTGIGFAMAMNREYLDRIGGFDTAFGRGYGEEVDWCQKARRVGGRHVLAANLFIGHEGGSSFGSAEKTERVRAAGKIITARYPGYDAEVRAWAESAPHALQRAALSVAWLAAVSDRPVSVFLGHTLGGGAEVALRREIDSALEDGAPGVVILRAGGSSAWRLEIEGKGVRHAVRIPDLDTLADFLQPLQHRRVIYSCGVGARDPRDVPMAILALSDGEGHRLELRLHDFFAISPSYCLLDSAGRFSGVPDEADPDPVHGVAAAPGRPALSLGGWRDLWRGIVARADRIVAFSASSAALMREAYAEAGPKIVLRPHALPALPAPVASRGKSIGVLGGINRAKGAEVVIGLAHHLDAGNSEHRVVIIGELDPAYRLPPRHAVTGRYARADIARLAVEHDVGVWLIPSIWPETFSFATREALATGLPVLTFDLGAQAEAVRAADNGHVLDRDPDDFGGIADALLGHLPDEKRL